MTAELLDAAHISTRGIESLGDALGPESVGPYNLPESGSLELLDDEWSKTGFTVGVKRLIIETMFDYPV